MRNQFRICGVLGTATAAFLGIAGSGLAQTPTLDLKPGLWEVTSVGTMTGAPPIQPHGDISSSADDSTERAKRALFASG